jgi:hypothetical protein
MIGAFWNIRSLNKTGRLECLKIFIDNNSLDFVGIHETKKDAFHQSFFNCFGDQFSWNFLPACGTAGGVLVGLRKSKFNILRSDIKQFCISAFISNSRDNFSWRLISVYGSAYDEHK